MIDRINFIDLKNEVTDGYYKGGKICSKSGMVQTGFTDTAQYVRCASCTEHFLNVSQLLARLRSFFSDPRTFHNGLPLS